METRGVEWEESNPWLYVIAPRRVPGTGRAVEGRIHLSCFLSLSLLVTVVKCLLIEKSGEEGRLLLCPPLKANAELPPC